MKVCFFVFIFLFAYATWSAQPEQFCGDNSECTPQMQEIVSLYKNGNANFIKAIISGYSGECYHLNFQFDPEIQHHGAFVFKKENTQTTALGVFSFFAAENPYRGMSTQELEKVLEQSSSPSALAKTNDPVTLTYDYPETQINYWFRSSEDGKQLFVLGQESHLLKRNQVFCKLRKH